MERKRFALDPIGAVLKQPEVGVSEQTFYRWKKQYSGLGVDQVRRLKQLQVESVQLK